MGVEKMLIAFEILLGYNVTDKSQKWKDNHEK